MGKYVHVCGVCMHLLNVGENVRMCAVCVCACICADGYVHVCGVCTLVWVDVYVCGVCVCVHIVFVCIHVWHVAPYFTSLTVLFSFSCPSSCVRLDVHF